MVTFGQVTAAATTAYMPFHLWLLSVVARDKVANVLLASKGRGASGGSAHTAQDLARSIARELLGPLLETACSRLASLLRHAFDIAADSQQLLQGTHCKSYGTMLYAA